MMKVYTRDTNVKKYPCNLYACLRFLMIICRWSGFFPVQGLDQLATDRIKLPVKSLYRIYNMATIIGHLTMVWFSWIEFFHELTLISLSKAVWFLSTLFSAILLIRFARQWPILMRKAKEIEERLIKLNLGNCVIMQSTIIAGVIMLLALVEHTIGMYFSVNLIMDYLNKTAMPSNIIEIYVTRKLPYMFNNNISYSHFLAVVIELLYIQAALIWNFNDVLIICFSIYITSYFEKLNKAIRSRKYNSTISWGQLRENYSKLTMLVKEINRHLSPFILMSSFLNVFHICVQLYHSLRIKPTSYFTYSFIFVMAKSLALYLFAAHVHVTARKPIVYVIDVPSSDYDKEIQMFQLQLRFTKVALCGRYFYITRNMILKVIGTIITYELILLQFNRKPVQFNMSGLLKFVNATSEI